jgi:hypothetical protein
MTLRFERQHTHSAPPFSRIAQLESLLRRVPWLITTISFATGWLGFVMVKRGEGFAYTIALVATAGWVWLLIEPLVRRYLERRKQGVGKLVANFLSQSIQQEMLFFCLPFFVGATQRDVGQIVFTVSVAIAALLGTIDPLYEKVIGKRAAARLMFHGYCSLITAVVVLPMVVHLSLEAALPLAILGVTAWLVLTLPMSLASLHTSRQKFVWIASMLISPLLLWALRSQIPPAGIVVTEGIVTQTLSGLTPGPSVHKLTHQDLGAGVVAFVAIRAPMGVAQSIIFEWRYGDESERIVAAIHGGNTSGWRTYARKESFPADSRGRWTVDILTPQGQLLKRMWFVVE